MNANDERASLRAAVYKGDGQVVVQLLRSGVPEARLQLAGDGLIAALAQRVEGAQEIAGRTAEALRERDWEGDEDLADQLDALTGTGATPMLRALAVDLDMLSSVLEGDPESDGGRIDLTTGDIFPEVSFDYGEEDEDETEDPGKWLRVDCEGSRDGYRDMQRFIGAVSDSSRADLLVVAIQGRGAFRRFQDVLDRWPDELERWYVFSGERQRGRARAWLTAAGYRVQHGASPSRRKPVLAGAGGRGGAGRGGAGPDQA